MLGKPCTNGPWRWSTSCPGTRAGSDDLRNLQALCFRCNAGKRDTDSTDFRGLQASYASREAGCVFCALEGSGRVLLEDDQQQAEQSLSADL